MDNKEKIEYINSLIDFKGAAIKNSTPNCIFFDKLPKRLYKYRPFDQYTFEMLNEGYIYLSKAEDLDDPLECVTNFDISNYFDSVDDEMNFECYNMIFNILKPVIPDDKLDLIKDIVFKCIKPDYSFDSAKALNLAMEIDDIVDNVNAPLILNAFANIPNMFQEKDIQENMEKLFCYAKDARKIVGICSLTENANSKQMWEDYAEGYSGYCIEYDFEHDVEVAIDTFPVVYDDERQNNVLRVLVELFINGLIKKYSKRMSKVDCSQFFRLFLTKESKKWSHQNEWRVLGDAGEHKKAPKIVRIYLGKNVSSHNATAMAKFCSENNIELVCCANEQCTVKRQSNLKIN